MTLSIDPKLFEECHILVVGDLMLDRNLWETSSGYLLKHRCQYFKLKTDQKSEGAQET